MFERVFTLAVFCFNIITHCIFERVFTLWAVFCIFKDIDLQVFTKCNKLRQLTTDIAVIAKALKRSKILELSSDGLKVHRKIPFEEPRDADHRTVYVV